jgi:DDE superfamily endonuclease
LSVAALLVIKPGHRPRMIYRTHCGQRRSGRGEQRGGGRKGFTETDYAALLDGAQQQVAGPMVLVWDNLNTHVSRRIRRLIEARSWLSVYRLPAYPPDLNPVEGLWSHLKRSLANLSKQSLDQLTALIKTRLRRMRYRPGLIDGFIARTALDFQPP